MAEKKHKKKIVFCPSACPTAKCIHGFYITKCTSCVNRLSLKHPQLYEKRAPCGLPCDDPECLEKKCQENVKKIHGSIKCPNDCVESTCLKSAKYDPNEDLPPELIPCICNSQELMEYAEGPVNSIGTQYIQIKPTSKTSYPIGRVISRLIERDTGIFEVILREPVCERHSGWNKRLIKKSFLDGSVYEGTENELGFMGEGKLKLPHGVTYEGEFDQGTFHGLGLLTYPNGVGVYGSWKKGINTSIKWIRFSDGLKYLEDKWSYLLHSDRRFYPEYKEDFQPETSLYRTAKWPTPQLPPGTYDTGDGYYSPILKCIFDYETNETLRIPREKEVNWIKENCRYGWRETIGNKLISQ